MVRGASVSPGYWREESGAEATTDGWLRTGDIGQVDAAGNLYFKGRKKDVIVTAAGLNIYPEDLEAVLNRQPDVRASCIIEWKGASGTEPLAVLILRAAEANVEAAISRANQQLAEYQQIRRWYVWPEPDFPRTSTHKILKREVAATVSARLNAEGKSKEDLATDRGEHDLILSEAARISGCALPANIGPSAKLTTDLKLDSLARVELLSVLEERYGVEINEAAFITATTVGDVSKLFSGPVEERVAPYTYPKWTRKFPLTWVRALLFYTVILPITRMMSRMRVSGSVHLDELKEPVMFVANHVTMADHALILTALPVRLRHRLAIAMDGERLRDWLHPSAETGWFLRLRLLAQYVLVNIFFNIFPLPKRGGFRRSFAYAGECIDRGESVLVFPEGERAPRGQMTPDPFKSGTGLLAKELGVPVVPVKLQGLYELKLRRQYFAPPGMVRVVFGAPVKFDANDDPAEVARELERRVNEL
jgi:long-chain acyl-CoA synthetase